MVNESDEVDLIPKLYTRLAGKGWSRLEGGILVAQVFVPHRERRFSNWGLLYVSY